MLSAQLAAKCLKRIVSEAPSPIHKLIRTILFGIRSWFFDINYKELTKEQLFNLLKDFKKYLEQYGLHYENEYFDCDDFAVALKNFAVVNYKTNGVGIALGILKKDGEVLGGHAWNIAILDNGDIVYIEPQTCEHFYSNKSPDGFEYELLVVVW